MVTEKYSNLIMAYTILHCLARMNRGGAETFIMNIFRHIDCQKYNFCFLLNEKDCDYTEEIQSMGGRIYTIPFRSSGIIQYCKSIDTFFKEHVGEFNAVHIHTSSLSSLEILYFAKKYGIRKRIIHSHNTVQAGLIHNILHWLNKPWLHFLATDYLACSKVAANWLYRFSGVLKKAIIINNGIDLKLFEFNEDYRKEIRHKYDIAPDEIVIGHVGRFDVVKNHTFLIDIYESYLKLNPNSKLVCVGVGNMIECINEKVHQKGLVDKVIFAGLQKDIYKYLSAFDYFVFPSLYEGLPVALVEAQASGLMTICSDKVSSEVRLSEYLSQYELSRSADEWAKYINEIKVLDRIQWVYQLEEYGYDINRTVKFLTDRIYV